jgi:hypothetical protein
MFRIGLLSRTNWGSQPNALALWMKPSCIAKLQDEKKLNFSSFMLKVLVGKKITRSSTPISIRPHFVFSEESSIP